MLVTRSQLNALCKVPDTFGIRFAPNGYLETTNSKIAVRICYESPNQPDSYVVWSQKHCKNLLSGKNHLYELREQDAINSSFPDLDYFFRANDDVTEYDYNANNLTYVNMHELGIISKVFSALAVTEVKCKVQSKRHGELPRIVMYSSLDDTAQAIILFRDGK